MSEEYKDYKCVRADIDNENGTLTLEFRDSQGYGWTRTAPVERWIESIENGFAFQSLTHELRRQVRNLLPEELLKKKGEP